MKLGSLKRLRAMMTGIGFEIKVLFLSPEPVLVKGELAVIKMLAVNVFWLSGRMHLVEPKPEKLQRTNRL